MSTPAPSPATAMPVTTSTFDKIILALEVATEIFAVVPTPFAPFAPIALKLEQVVGAAIGAQAASSGQTVAQVVAQLHQIQQIP